MLSTLFDIFVKNTRQTHKQQGGCYEKTQSFEQEHFYVTRSGNDIYIVAANLFDGVRRRKH